MFEISWSELLILAVVTLIFVGPKDLPKFLNTMGRYAGMVRRQAAEFRAQFDEAMRQAELDALKKEVNEVRTDIEASVRDAQAPAVPQGDLQSTPSIGATLPLGRTAQEIKDSAAATERASEAAQDAPKAIENKPASDAGDGKSGA